MEKTYKYLKLAIWILALAVLILGATMLYNNLSSQVELGGIATVPQETQGAVETGAETTPEQTEASLRMAPDFTVYDLEGNPHKLSDFQGKPVILNFWASWCGPCASEMPEFQNYYDEYGEQIHFVLVNLTDGNQETVESASAFLTKHGYTMPVYYDTDINAAMVYGVNAVPVSYFITADGGLRAWAQGALSADMLQQGVDLLLSEA